MGDISPRIWVVTYEMPEDPPEIIGATISQTPHAAQFLAERHAGRGSRWGYANGARQQDWMGDTDTDHDLAWYPQLTPPGDDNYLIIPCIPGEVRAGT